MTKAVEIVKEFLRDNKEARVDAYAAQTAFYIIMGFIPFIMLILIMLQYIPLTEENLLDALQQVFPEAFWDYLKELVESIYVKNTAILSGTVIAALWASGRSMMAIINGLNSIYGIRETRNYVFCRLRAMGYLIVLLICLVLALGLLVFGNTIHGFLMDRSVFLQKHSDLIIWLRTGGTILVLTLLMSAIYAYLPNIKTKFTSQLPGAALAAVSWSVFSYVISLYVGWKEKFTSIYGSLTMVVMIMLWLYFLVYLLFAGAQFNRIWMKEHWSARPEQKSGKSREASDTRREHNAGAGS